MLWVDQYRPQTLDDLDLHEGVTSTLRHLAASQDLPHLLFYGPSGSGRKARAMCVLREIYGPTVYSLQLQHKSLVVSDSKTVDMALLSSPHHIDLNPSDAGNYDRVVVMQLIKEIAQTVPLSHLHRDPVSASSSTPSPAKFKTVILNEVDRMSRSAQHALRRTMEKYMRTCRLVLICSSLSRLIAPLRSRCLGIRVPGHTEEGLRKAVLRVCAAEKLPNPSSSFVSLLYEKCEGNLRRGLLMLQAAAMNGVALTGPGTDIPLPDWKSYLQEISQQIMMEQTPRGLYEIRRMFYDLLGQCISGDTIMKELLLSLISLASPKLHADIFRLAAKFDYAMKVGSKPIVHLEAFTAAVMQLIKAA